MNKSDIKLILIIILFIVVLVLVKELTFKKSNYAYVYYENKEILKINLKIDDTYSVNGYNGEVIIEVKDSKIRVKKENSPLHICSKEGYVSDSTPIICLPNKIVIKIESKNDELDSITS